MTRSGVRSPSTPPRKSPSWTGCFFFLVMPQRTVWCSSRKALPQWSFAALDGVRALPSWKVPQGLLPAHRRWSAGFMLPGRKPVLTPLLPLAPGLHPQLVGERRLTLPGGHPAHLPDQRQSGELGICPQGFPVAVQFPASGSAPAPVRAVTMPREAAQAPMSAPCRAVAISSGKKSGVQAKTGMFRAARRAALPWS